MGFNLCYVSPASSGEVSMPDESAEEGRSAHDPTAAEAAAYIERMLAGLHDIAAEHRALAMLTYILGIARQEAAARAKEPG
jgi:hypothetical protein